MNLTLPALRITSLCVVLGVLVACAGLEPAGRAVSEAERREYASAISTLPEDLATAESRLEAFVRNWPQSRLAAEAVLQLAELARQRGDREVALQRFYRVLRDYPDSRRVDSARLAIAALEYERGRRDIAVRMLRETRLKAVSPEERQGAYRLLADTAGSAAERLRWLVLLRAARPDQDAQTAIDGEIDTLIAVVDDVVLAQLADRIDPDVPAGRMWLTLADRALDRGDLEQAARYLDRASDLPLIAAYASRAGRAGERLRLLVSGGDATDSLPSFAAAERAGLPDTRSARGEIGVVLPLSGKFASFGEESLRGILLATGAFDAARPADDRPAIHLLIRDTQGRADLAAAAVRELAQRENLQVILGPLLAKECEAAASAAEFEGVPLVALTSREEIARDRTQVFRVRTMPKDEVQTLAEHAIRDLGVTRFGILYPSDAYGRGLSDLFWNAVEMRGGSVVALASYEPNATDFSASIRRLVGWELLTSQQKDAIEIREAMISSARRLLPDEASLIREEARAMLGPDGEQLPPIIDFDALFIPETHENVVLIAPQLAYNEVTGAVLLGSEAWNHSDLVEIGRHHVEGARFTANFYDASPVVYVREFADRYAATFGIPAEDFAAQAYDAANLVLVPLARGVQTRASLRDAVLSTSGFAGASGILSMGADGNARKRPFLLGVKRGKIVQLD
jgi:branched-chain amino acid transport system substrate-binding protein